MPIEAYGNAIHVCPALHIGDPARTAELVLQLKDVQRELKHPLVSAKHIGLNVQTFVIDLRHLGREPLDFDGAFINPEVLSFSVPLVSRFESDLSLPGLAVSIERPRQIKVTFSDEQMNVRTAVFSDLAAQWVQHGVDHLNGITMIDRINRYRQHSLKRYLRQ